MKVLEKFPLRWKTTFYFLYNTEQQKTQFSKYNHTQRQVTNHPSQLRFRSPVTLTECHQIIHMWLFIMHYRSDLSKLLESEGGENMQTSLAIHI